MEVAVRFYAVAMDTFFFDHLPLHPPPESDESLTGYLRRLASVNGLPSVNSLAVLADTPLNYLINHPDIPLNDYHMLARLSAQPADSLRDLTFQHLMAKFGRGDPRRRAGPFLNRTLAFHLRYCPQCLAESLYYRLVWRFKLLQGCPHHGCRFLEVCPGCGEAIPLFSAPFDLSKCPHCKADLLHTEVRPLAAAQYDGAITAYHELIFLLRPHDWPVDQVAHALGPQLAALRKQSRISISDMAAKLATTTERIKGLESRDYQNRRGVNLQHYLKYTAVLDLKLRDVFLDLVQKELNNIDLTTVTRSSLYEELLLKRAQAAVAELEALDVIVTQAAIGQIMGMGVPTLRYYPRLRTFLEEFSDQARLQALREDREQQLVDEAAQAIQTLRDRGERVTAAAIGRLLGRAPEGFHYYPRLKALVDHETDDRARYEAMLLSRVMTAIEQIRAEGDVVTQSGIGRRVGMTPEGLKRYKNIAAVLEYVARELEHYYSEREDNLVQLIYESVEYLESQRMPVEQERIAEIVGLAVNSLKHHKGVKTILQEITVQYKKWNVERKAETRDWEMVAQIETAAAELHAEGQRVTREAILSRTGIAKRTLVRHKHASATIKDVVAFYRRREQG